MAFGYAVRTIRWLAADGVATTYAISGLSFAPAAIKCSWVGIGSATDAVSSTTNERRGRGFAVSTSSRRCVATMDVDAAANADTDSVARDDCVVATTDGAGTTDGRLDISSFDSGGVTFVVDDQGVADIVVIVELWGGSDITVAVVGDIAEPAATGNQDYTATGFVSGATDQIVMLAGVQSTAALNTGAVTDSGLHVGYATASAGATVCNNSDEGSANMDTDRYGQSGECLSMITTAGGNPNARATLTQWNTNGFRLNWAARGVTNRRSIFLAIKGGQWAVGELTIDGGTASATSTVSGLAFAPVGISLISHNTSESTAATSQAGSVICFGAGTSTTDRVSLSSRAQTATANAQIEMGVEYDEVLHAVTGAGALGPAWDIDAMNSDGFRLITDVTGGGATDWIAYLAFAATPVVVVIDWFREASEPVREVPEVVAY